MRTSHKEVGFLLVGVDALGDPLRQKFDPQKTKNNPDSLSGFIYSLSKLPFIISSSNDELITNFSFSVFIAGFAFV